MFKIIAFVLLVAACVYAKPKPDIVAYSAPLVAAPYSSAVVSREFHGNTAPYLSAYSYSPYVGAYSAAPYVASPYASPYSAYASTYYL